ncbi:ISAon1 family transposase N-terminal region protein [Halosquirtibacter xylanolyticus]
MDDELTSKEFLPDITIQDFPLRNKSLYSRIRRRKWTNETSGKVITRNWIV